MGAAVNLATVNAGFAAAFGLIDGTGDYTFDLTGSGQVQYHRPLSLDSLEDPSLVYWFGELADSRNDRNADLSQYGQTLEWFLLARVSMDSTGSSNLTNGWNLEADIRRALHLSRRLPVANVGSVYDITYTTRVVTGEDMGVTADGVYVQGAGTAIWARF